MSELIISPEKTQQLPVFETMQGFEQAAKMVGPLVSTDLVPAIYKNNRANCMIAMETAYRLKESVLTVMQNTSIIHGKPALDSKFIIGLINKSGKFSEPLDFEYSGDGDNRGCVAFTKRGTRDVVGTKVTVLMAKQKGWYNKSGSSWPTMEDLMLAYRAATFFSRLHCPEVTLGLQTIDELTDIGVDETQSQASETVAKVNATVAPETKIKATEEYTEFENLIETEVDSPEIVGEAVHKNEESDDDGLNDI